MDELGARLKRAREERGVSLSHIATRTKISVVALDALERNDVSRLPGGIFGRAFVRAYAVEIGLDPEETVAAFQVRLEESEREAAERGATRVEISSDDREFLARQQRALRLLKIAAVVFAAVAVVFLIWSLRPFLRAHAVASTETPRAVAVIQTSSEPERPVASPQEDPAPVEIRAAMSSPPSPTVEFPADQPLVLEVSVMATCWIFASADGTRVLSKLFRPGDTERIAAKREVYLDVGNAGAVRWSINGKTAKPLGQAGAHTKTTVTLDTLSSFVD